VLPTVFALFARSVADGQHGCDAKRQARRSYLPELPDASGDGRNGDPFSYNGSGDSVGRSFHGPPETGGLRMRDQPPALELRSTKRPPVVRGGRRIGGLAIVYNKSHMLNGFHEVVEPSFARKSEADGWPGVTCRYEHDPKMLLGTINGKTLPLENLHEGVDYTVDVPESREDVLESVRRLDVAGSIFGFHCYTDEFSYDGGVTIRHLVNGRIRQVSPICNPAYPDATVAMQSPAQRFDAPLDDVIGCGGPYSRFPVRTDNVESRPESVREERGMRTQDAYREFESLRSVQGPTVQQLELELWQAKMDWEARNKSVADARPELAQMCPYQTAASAGLPTNSGHP
jgi:phage head maturation protease